MPAGVHSPRAARSAAWLLLVVAAGLSLVMPRVAAAHEGDTKPAAVAARPSTGSYQDVSFVEVMFSLAPDGVVGDEIVVTDAAGKAHSGPTKRGGDPKVLHVDVDLPEAGTYKVTYYALVAGHRPSGSYEFTYLGGTAGGGKGSLTPFLALGGGVLLLSAGTAVALTRQRKSHLTAG